MCTRNGHPVIIYYQPQIGFKALNGCLSGEEELVDSFDGSPEHTSPPVEGSAHIHQHLAVLDPVQFAIDLGWVRRKEVDLLGRH